MPATSVLRSRQPFELFLQPLFELAVFPPATFKTPPAVPVLLPGNPPSLGPPWPYCRSISIPSTALTFPTSNVKSGRNRVRAYQLPVVVSGQVSVVKVPTRRRYLVEQSRDRDSWRRSLGEDGRHQDRQKHRSEKSGNEDPFHLGSPRSRAALPCKLLRGRHG